MQLSKFFLSGLQRPHFSRHAKHFLNMYLFLLLKRKDERQSITYYQKLSHSSTSAFSQNDYIYGKCLLSKGCFTRIIHIKYI
ncbi:hypothetical protein PUN28_005716 [Cardiocondyla obscurior]|uniref:Uncharacterized protein n=1 Tax=Cardiocondyla obscurior TaxID=286306 RepID=A0AAW2G6Y1_9HYME